MARAASALPISTNAKPRGRPVSRSVIKETFSTAPCLENKVCTSASVAVKGRLPTYSFVTAEYSEKSWGNRQLCPASWVRGACAGGGHWPEGAPGTALGPRAVKPKGY